MLCVTRASRCRALIKKDVSRIKGLFRRAVEHELLPVAVHQDLMGHIHLAADFEDFGAGVVVVQEPQRDVPDRAATLCVTSSPRWPSPRVAPRVRRPFS